FVVEAVTEDLPLKQALFAKIERYVRDDTILASNTSVIPITAIMGGLEHRERALGTHWWNPPFLVPLVEVIGTQWTSRQAIDQTVLPDIDARPGPSPYLERLVAEGKLGFKSGQGFRQWSAPEQTALRAKVMQHLKKSRDA